jgi:hypothetical protein
VNYISDFRGRLDAFNICTCSLATFGTLGWITRSGGTFSTREPESGRKAIHRRVTIQNVTICGNSVRLTYFLAQFRTHRSNDKELNGFNYISNQLVARKAGMAELADAADSKSAGT